MKPFKSNLKNISKTFQFHGIVQLDRKENPNYPLEFQCKLNLSMWLEYVMFDFR